MDQWVVAFVLAVIVNLTINLAIRLIFFNHTHGILRVDRSDPEKDIYRIEIDDLDCLAKCNRIVLKIDSNADLSQK